jgi:ABC-type transport system involved in cytochrome c biogenesis ATPase subunit/ABC-type transport system involved in multi-copper enzyme maturation permease subunit
MNGIKYIINIEWKRFWRPRNIILLTLFVIIALYFLMDGLLQYNEVIKIKEEFKNIEQQKIEKFRDYNFYGNFGFRIFFVPSPVSVFFHNSGKFFILTANLNVSERLDIDVSLKGKGMIREKSFPYSDFAGIYCLVGILLVLLYGFEGLRDREYLKFLSYKKGINNVFSKLFLARLLIINLFFLAIILLAILLVMIFGIHLSVADFLFLAIFFGFWLLISFIMSVIGAIAGSINHRGNGLIALFITWFLLVFLIPNVINNISASNAGAIPSNYRNELDILTELWNFEKIADEKVGKFSEELRSTKAENELVDDFLENQYKNMQRIEDKLENITAEKIKAEQKLEMVLPTSFYNSVRSELSSKGYGSIAAFYRYAKELKHRFSMFYRWKKFQTKETKVENFIKGEENIYYARPQLPPYFLLGVIIYALIAVVLFFLSLVLNSRVIYRIAEDKYPPGNAEPLFLKWGKYKILKVIGESFKDYLLNLLTGKTREIKRSKYRYPGQVYLEEEKITADSKKFDTFYITPVENIPLDIRVYDLLAYFSSLSGNKGKAIRESLTNIGVEDLLKQRFWQLNKVDQLKVLLAAASLVETEVYLLYDLSRQMPGEGLILIKEKLEELSKKGAVVIFLTTESIINDIGRMTNNYYNEIDGKWSSQVEEIRKLIEYEKTQK